jgi:hypothetical protein
MEKVETPAAVEEESLPTLMRSSNVSIKGLEQLNLKHIE